jgi:hypothetical protein
MARSQAENNPSEITLVMDLATSQERYRHLHAEIKEFFEALT